MRSVLARVASSAFVIVSLALVVPRGARLATSAPEPPPVPAPALPPHQPFTPYAADEGALAFDELSEREQRLVEAERTRETAEVREARFATLKAMTIARGERTHAEAQAAMIGLAGAGGEGVVP